MGFRLPAASHSSGTHLAPLEFESVQKCFETIINVPALSDYRPRRLRAQKNNVQLSYEMNTLASERYKIECADCTENRQVSGLSNRI